MKGLSLNELQQEHDEQHQRQEQNDEDKNGQETNTNEDEEDSNIRRTTTSQEQEPITLEEQQKVEESDEKRRTKRKRRRRRRNSLISDNDDEDEDDEYEDNEEDEEEDDVDNYEVDNNAAELSLITSPLHRRIEHFLTDLLGDHQSTRPRFICLCCQCKFDLGAEFLLHLDQSHRRSFAITNQQDRFIRNETTAVSSSTDTAAAATGNSNKMLIGILMEKKMKQKFLANYSQDLLVGNEETALYLEQLNKDYRLKNAHKKSVCLTI